MLLVDPGDPVPAPPCPRGGSPVVGSIAGDPGIAPPAPIMPPGGTGGIVPIPPGMPPGIITGVFVETPDPPREGTPALVFHVKKHANTLNNIP